MKPKPLLTALVAIALSAGLLWAFPAAWMALVLVLLGLLTALAALIRRGLTVTPAHQGAPPLRVVRMVESAGPSSAFANQDGTPAKPVLDPAAFARFRAHLESVEQKRGLRTSDPRPDPKSSTAPARADVSTAPIPKQPAAPPTADDTLAGASAGVTDQVALSARSAPLVPMPAAPKVKSAPTYAPQRRTVSPNAARPNAALPSAMPPSPAAPNAATRGGKSKPASALAPKSASKPLAEAATDASEEVDLFEDLRPNRKGALPTKAPPKPAGDLIREAPTAERPSDEAAALLKMAEDANRRGDLNAARAALDQHLALVPAAAATWPAHRLNLRLAAHDGRPQLALDSFDAMVKAGFTLKQEALPALLDEVLEGVLPDLADSLRVSLLLKALGVFRQQADRPAMDHVYRMLIEAQERVGDERKLVQFLKNHLDIKKAMGESTGQLELIDQIGNRLFKLGETAEAREYYELGLKLRAEARQSESAPTPAKTGTTPQTA